MISHHLTRSSFNLEPKASRLVITKRGVSASFVLFVACQTDWIKLQNTVERIEADFWRTKNSSMRVEFGKLSSGDHFLNFVDVYGVKFFGSLLGWCR